MKRIHSFLAVSLLLAGLTASQTLKAQTVRGCIADTALNKKMYLCYNPERGGSRYDGDEKRIKTDAKGDFSVSVNDLGKMDFCPAYLVLADGSEHDFFLEKGQTIEVFAKRDKKGKLLLDYKGSDADASRCLRDFEKTYEFTDFFAYPGEQPKLAKDIRISTLDARYQTLAKSIKKIKNSNLRSFLTQLNENRHDNFLCRLLPKSDNRHKEAVKRLQSVSPNDWIGLYNIIPQAFIEEHMDTTVHAQWGGDQTAYGLEYLRVMKQYITDPDVKHQLLAECARETIDYGKDFKDIDAFWKPFAEYAQGDSVILEHYAMKVNALKQTRPGMEAKDFSFEDAQGKQYRLSDLRGKVVYIDVWATWCGPCKREIPYLAKRVEEYKGNDKVVFISISVDQNRKAWLSMIENDKPQWAQYHVSEEQNRTMSEAYGITAIPRFMVIKADGTIGNSDAFRPSDDDFHKELDAFL